MRRPLLLALGLFVSASAYGKDKPRVYDSTRVEDLDALAKALKRHVAYVEVKIAKPDNQPLLPATRDGYALVLDPTTLTVLAHTVKDAKGLVVRGPGGKMMAARVVAMDMKSRVAILRTGAPMDLIGLAPPPLVAKKARKEGQDVFALVDTDDKAGVVHGVLTELGDIPEYEGHPRVDLKLHRGMPIFDKQARALGFSRVVAWDVDRFMMIPMEMIDAVREKAGS